MTLLMFGNERNFCIQIYVDVDKKERERECFSLLQVLASWHWSLFVIINKHTAGGRAQKSLIKTTECRCWPLIDELAEGDEAKYWNISKNFFSHSFNKKNKTKKNTEYPFQRDDNLGISRVVIERRQVEYTRRKMKDKNRNHRCSFGRPGPFWLASEWCIHDIPPVSWHDWRPPKVTGPWRHKMSSTQTIAQLNSISLFNSIEKILPVNRYDNDERLELVDLEIEICISNVSIEIYIINVSIV